MTEGDRQFILDLDNALDKMQNYRGNLIRYIDIQGDEEIQKFWDSFTVGKTRRFQEYLSTSTKKGYNPHANFELYIKRARSGKDIRSHNPEEAEVLYKRGSQFRVIGKRFYDAKGIIYLEEV